MLVEEEDKHDLIRAEAINTAITVSLLCMRLPRE
jgi:hypothetical protein